MLPVSDVHLPPFLSFLLIHGWNAMAFVMELFACKDRLLFRKSDETHFSDFAIGCSLIVNFYAPWFALHSSAFVFIIKQAINSSLLLFISKRGIRVRYVKGNKPD
jgi:hypothetical protein